MAESRRIVLRVAYDGTEYFGWQRQSRGRTVQGVLEEMLSRLSGNAPVTVVGAGRTDSGVHASGQIAHADIASRFSDAELLLKMQRMLPSDLAVYGLATVPPNFHARFKAISRSYAYAIISTPDPFRHRYSWLAPHAVHLAILNEAAHIIMGEHDFTTFSKINPDTESMVCLVSEANWLPERGGVVFRIKADRFLYGMVRLLVGVQLDVARGKVGLNELSAALIGRDRRLQSMSAPAQGLFLTDISYPEEFEIP